jgi:hypothetical protein
MRLDPCPLLVTQPKQILAHEPDPLPKTNQDRIVMAKKLMSFDPSFRRETWILRERSTIFQQNVGSA